MKVRATMKDRYGTHDCGVLDLNRGAVYELLHNNMDEVAMTDDRNGAVFIYRKVRVLPPPTGMAFYLISPEEGGASDIEAMWLAEDEFNLGREREKAANEPPQA